MKIKSNKVIFKANLSGHDKQKLKNSLIAKQPNNSSFIGNYLGLVYKHVTKYLNVRSHIEQCFDVWLKSPSLGTLLSVCALNLFDFEALVLSNPFLEYFYISL